MVLRNNGCFNIPLEVDLVMNYVSQCIRGTRKVEGVLADRTPVNAIAYAKLLVLSENEVEKRVFDKCEQFIKEWVKLYDCIFYCQDYFAIDLSQDITRRKVVNIQKEVDLETRRKYCEFECKLDFIPKGLSLEDRTRYVLDGIKALL